LAPEVDGPCIICPNGAAAGYDYFQPFAGAEKKKTCKELLDDLTIVAVEGGSDLCESIREIDAMCCVNDDSTPSRGTLYDGTMAKSPTDPSSGGASVSGLVDFAFISIVNSVRYCLCERHYKSWTLRVWVP
jgi:hypothetical protein